MLVYINKGKTYYSMDGRNFDSADLGLTLFNYVSEHLEDTDLQEVINVVFLEDGLPTENYLELCSRRENRYRLENYHFTTFLLVEKNKLHHAYDVQGLEDVIFIELVTLIMNNSRITRCKRCGRLFVTKNNHNANYCDRLDEVLGVACSKLGSAEAYKEKLTKNPILQEYQKAYKRLYARVRNGNMEQSDFDNWVRDITIERDICAAEFERTRDVGIVEGFMKRVGNKKK